MSIKEKFKEMLINVGEMDLLSDVINCFQNINKILNIDIESNLADELLKQEILDRDFKMKLNIVYIMEIL